MTSPHTRVSIITYHSKKYEFLELIDQKELWMYHATIADRIRRGWTVNKAFDTPVRPQGTSRRLMTNQQAKDAYKYKCKHSRIRKEATMK